MTQTPKVSPLAIQMALACYCSPEPQQFVGCRTWNSPAGKKVQEWLKSSGMVDTNYSSTPKLRDWVFRLKSVEPVEQAYDKPSFKRGEILQSTVEHGCVVEFYEWVDETKTAFHGHLLKVQPTGMFRVEWCDNWNGDVFEPYTEAPMQSHLQPSEVQEALINFISAKYNKKVRNIKFDAKNGLVTYET